ncbi:MAG: RtcB family protein [Ruminococcus sp.]|nr:RtcB family protein [Ruminococcus sp.]
MIILKGKYGKAKVYTDNINESAIKQIIELLNQSFVGGLTVRIMPDVHAGKGCTIGTTMTIKDKIVPNLVGVDIGCGMEVVKLKEEHIELQKLDKLIYARIPSGMRIRRSPHRYNEQIDLNELCCKKHVSLDRAYLSLGTLGGGNHFIEADIGDDGSFYIVVHSGSRHLGLEVAQYYQNEAYRRLMEKSDVKLEEIIAELKADGRQSEIDSTLKAKRENISSSVPKSLAYVEGELFDEYIHDMRIVQRFAALNRQAMIDEIVKGMGFHVNDQFTTIHNYIDTDSMILRKGAVSAKAGERLIIPINMRDGSLICTGKGNSDWNFSAPHGAGRVLSRSQAKSEFTLSEFKKQMNGIYTTSVHTSTIDECPMAYKPIDEIIENVKDTVTVNEIIKPVYNFKAK